MKSKMVKLSDLADIIVGFPFKSQYFNTNEKGVRLVRGKNITRKSLRWGDDTRWWDDFTYDIERYYLCDKDIVIGMDGSLVGKNYACIRESDLPLLLVQRVACIRAKKGVSQEFLWQCIANTSFEDYINAIKTGTTIPHISGKQIGDYEVPLFEYSIQQRIGAFLINDNLSEQAHAIFQSWFIDYVPFDGLAPSNWIKTTLGEVCSCELGGTPSRAKPEYWNGNIPWINSGEVNLFRITKPSEMITELGLSKSATKLLPAKTTVIAITGATLGQISLLEIESCANQSVVGVIPNERLPYEFIYPYISSNIQELISHQTGGAQQHINKQNVEGLPIVVPSNDIMNEYVNLVHGYYSSIANNCFENERLAELRDTLLPRLMSGELDVSDLDL